MNAERIRCRLFAFLGIAMAVSISAAEIALALLILDSLVGRRWTAGPTRRSPAELGILVFFAWGVFVTLFAGSARWSKAVSGQSALLFYILAVRSWSADDNERWLRWFLYAAAATGGFAVIQVLLGVDRYPFQDELVVPGWLQGAPESILRFVSLRNERAIGTRSHPLTFAEGLLAAFVLLLAAPVSTSERWKRFRWAGIALVAAGLLFSQGRGVWIGVAASTLTLGVLWRRRREWRLGVAAGAVAAAIIVVSVPKIRERALTIVTPASGEAAGLASRDVRFQLWSAAWETISAHPVAGVGIKGVKLMVEDPTLKAPRAWSETHNIFLQTAAERGIVGLGLFLWVLGAFVAQSRRSPEGWREAGLALLVGFFLAGLSESWIKDKEVAMIFWAVMGAIENRRLTAAEPA